MAKTHKFYYENKKTGEGLVIDAASLTLADSIYLSHTGVDPMKVGHVGCTQLDSPINKDFKLKENSKAIDRK